MTKGQLPKAYLRMDPNLDQTHPDPGGFVRLLCAAARQPHRGRFSSRQLLDGILGRTLAKRLVDRRDLIQTKDGKWYVDGWDEWQEGDWTVAERQQRIRDRRVKSTSPDSDNGVTPPLSERDPQPNGLEATRQQGSKAEVSNENPAVEALLARGWRRVTAKQRQMLWEISDRHSYEWVAQIIRSTAKDADPIEAVKFADSAWQATRKAEVDAEERSWQAQKDAEPRNRLEVAHRAN